MKKLICLLAFFPSLAIAQKLKKADKELAEDLKEHIGYLADDKLEGRRTGTAGEKLAYEYITAQFTKNKLEAKGDGGGFIQEFEVNEGKQINASSYLIINGHKLTAEKDFFPLVYSPNVEVEGQTSFVAQNKGGIWFLDLRNILEENRNNPHFDVADAVKTYAIQSTEKGAVALIVYNSSKTDDGLKFEPKAKTETTSIPVIYVRQEYSKDRFNDNIEFPVRLKVDLGEKKRMGHNVIGYINNGATNTVILGAHYDHLGYGEDHNSLYTGSTPQIHNGADDNASGTAALIELSKILMKSKYKQNNYLFIAFSGEELGLYGSKHFTEHPTIDLSIVDYMINMDMVGRLNDSTHGLNIGGYGTSPAWGSLISEKNEQFKIKFDSSGTGPSDHTSFYRKDIPVLFFFTGVHSDYHKPSDDADKINYVGEVQVIKYIYSIIGAANEKDKLAFTKTRESATTAKSSFKVTLGIMPDYTFSGSGVRVDGVSEGKLAQRTGIKAGDVIVQLGDHKFSDVQTYMETLSKFNKGDATKVKLKRGTEELTFDIIF